MVIEEEHHSQNRERELRIYDATRDLLLHYGYDKTTVSDIANKAGISKGAIYLHFSSKDELVSALLKHEISAYTDEVLTVLEQDEDNLTFVNLYQKTLVLLPNYPLVQAIIRGDSRVFGAYLSRSSQEFIEIKRTQRFPLLKMMQDVGALRADVNMRVVAFILDCLGYGLLHASEFVEEDQIPEITAISSEMGMMLERYLMPDDGGNLNAARDILLNMIRSYRTQLFDEK
ncbi:MAG: helix-turn-helix domain-containing protein [Aggregatilineales bacterium]